MPKTIGQAKEREIVRLHDDKNVSAQPARPSETIGQAKEREIVRLHERGKPPVEIADAVGVNPATVKRLVEGGYHSPRSL